MNSFLRARALRPGSPWAAFCAIAVVVLAWPGVAAAQMPDPRQMSGMSMPAPELSAGTVTVRVVRDQITNNLAGVPVELHGAGDVRRATTGADGRAHFEGVPGGRELHAVAIVGSQRLESRPFDMPASGGVRTLLVATTDGGAPSSQSPGGPPAGAPPATTPSGDVASLALGGNSRVAMEFQDDVLNVFYLFEVVNRTSASITPASALVFDMPTGAEGTTVLEASTKNATAKGPRVTVTGPFAPGATPLQVAFRLDGIGSAASITSRFPLPLEAVSVAIQKIGDMTVRSPQIERMQDTPLDSAVFAMGVGPRLAAGSPLVLELAGLPHHSRVPVYVALGLAAAIVGAAVWFIVFPGQLEAAGGRRRALQQRREKGLAALAALEQDHRSGGVSEADYTARRAALVAQLERVYGELDAERGTPGGQGVAA